MHPVALGPQMPWYPMAHGLPEVVWYSGSCSPTEVFEDTNELPLLPTADEETIACYHLSPPVPHARMSPSQSQGWWPPCRRTGCLPASAACLCARPLPLPPFSDRFAVFLPLRFAFAAAFPVLLQASISCKSYIPPLKSPDVALTRRLGCCARRLRARVCPVQRVCLGLGALRCTAAAQRRTPTHRDTRCMGYEAQHHRSLAPGGCPAPPLLWSACALPPPLLRTPTATGRPSVPSPAPPPPPPPTAICCSCVALFQIPLQYQSVCTVNSLP